MTVYELDWTGCEVFMLDLSLADEFNQYRGAESGATVCPAPLINLHFSQLGVVTACCFNRNHVLGIYPQNSLQEIWNGEAANELREHLAIGDFAKGCDKCWQQVQARDFAGSHAVFYTRLARIMTARQQELGIMPQVAPSGTPLPMKLEFNIHNACNLQCIMCHGLASSAIRSRREGLDPMPNPYDDTFAEQLEPFLPQIVEADFIGGEPFLIPVYQTIWELIGRVNPQAKVCILTNATMLNERIKKILDGINCLIHISIDSHRKSTYETIRRGASFDQVMSNAKYFQDLMAERGLPVTWRFCPMRLNWHELPETASYCSENGIVLFYNQVDSPIGLSLNTLPVDELSEVVDTLETREPRLPSTPIGLGNLQNYRELVGRLRGFLRPENRLNGLHTRLETARAVLSNYSREKEDQVRRRESAGSLKNELTQMVKSYLITRLNVEQSYASGDGASADGHELLIEAERTLVALQDRIDFYQFLATYWKELIRTYSGVWGVVKLHEDDVFDRVDRLIAEMRIQGTPEHDDRWARILRPPPAIVYEAVGLASSVDDMRPWFENL